MLTSEAHDILRTIERRLRPARPPYQGDNEAFDDWSRLLANYDQDTARNAFAAHLEGGTGRWPNFYQFRDLLKRSRNKPQTNHTGSCDQCAGTGWHPGETMTLRGHEYSTAVPCSCPNGATAERSKIHTENAISLCPDCKGHGYVQDNPEEASRCLRCNGAGAIRPT